MGRGNQPSAGALFSRQQRRAAGELIKKDRYRVAVARLARGESDPARQLLHDEVLVPADAEELTDRLADFEATGIYDLHGARPDPDHPEYRIIRRATRREIRARPLRPAAKLLAQRPPEAIWGLSSLGPLAEALTATLRIEDLEPAHVWSLAERPDSVLGEVAREQIWEVFSTRISREMRSIGLDDGSHRCAVRIPPQSEIHLENPVWLRKRFDVRETCCGLVVSELKPALREEVGRSIAEHEDACGLCLSAVKGAPYDFNDSRPPRSLFGEREPAVRDAMFGRFEEIARSYRTSRWKSFIHAMAGDELTRSALTDELTFLFRERLRESDARLVDIPSPAWVELLVKRFGDHPVRELLSPQDVRKAVGSMITENTSGDHFLQALEFAIRRKPRS